MEAVTRELLRPPARGPRRRPGRRQTLLLLLAALPGAAEAQVTTPSPAREPPIGGTVEAHVPTELPRLGFPGATAAATNASWPSGHQPPRLSAWPQTGYGTPNRTLLPCSKVTVIHDTKTGWPGLCLNLFQAPKRTDLEACKMMCWREPRCSVWQFNNVSIPPGALVPPPLPSPEVPHGLQPGFVSPPSLPPTPPPPPGITTTTPMAPQQCWVGLGTECGGKHGPGHAPFEVLGAQRLMHGAVRVIKEMVGPKIANLYSLGSFNQSSEDMAILRCKGWCYSDIFCQYWQYGPGGCWAEARWFDRGETSQGVPYPLTTADLDQNTLMVAGEYIQHYCPPEESGSDAAIQPPLPEAEAQIGVTATEPTHSPSTTWMWIGVMVICVFCVGAMCTAMVVSGVFGGTGGKKTRRAAAVLQAESQDEDLPLMNDDMAPNGDDGGEPEQAPGGLPPQSLQQQMMQQQPLSSFFAPPPSHHHHHGPGHYAPLATGAHHLASLPPPPTGYPPAPMHGGSGLTAPGLLGGSGLLPPPGGWNGGPAGLGSPAPQSSQPSGLPPHLQPYKPLQ